MSRRNLAHDNLYSLERDVVSLFGKFTGRTAGAGERAMLRIDGIAAPGDFAVVGEKLTGTTSTAYGVVVKTTTVSASVQIVTLDGVTGGPFQDNEAITGNLAASGTVDGVDSTVPAPLAGDAIVSVTISNDPIVAAFVLEETVTGGTSTATGVVTRVDPVSATVQQLTIKPLTGTFLAGEAITGDVAGSGTAASLNFQFSDAQGGKGVGSLLPVCGATAGVGKYTLTLENLWSGLLQFKPSIMDATSPDDWEVVVSAETVATSKTLSLAIFKGGALADLTADDTLRFELVLSNVTVSPGY